MSLHHNDLLLNIKRQAKRLSKSLDIPLGHAQEMLAHVVYGCDNYGQLISLLKSDSFENHNLILAGLHPNAENFLFKFLNTHMDKVLSRFNEKIESLKINENLVIEVFGIEPTDFKKKVQ